MTTSAYSHCAYTQKVRKFANMMTARGHEVFLYAGEDNEADCIEHIVCITKDEQAANGFHGPQDYQGIQWEAEQPYFQIFNDRAIAAMRDRIQPEDFICLITSWPNAPIVQAFPNNMAVEYGIGYKGTMTNYLVFESYAWRNFVYGRKDSEGNFFHEVIPNYFEVDEFPFGPEKDDYFLFIGRLNFDKGYQVAIDTCRAIGAKLKVAGAGNPPDYGEYVGVVGPEERGELMARARAVFVPTIYVGPFEGVHVEAMLCGTPVITSDWGVFPETVVNGFNGYRCTMMREFIAAAQAVDSLDYAAIRNDAIAKYSTEAIAPRYERYFDRLATLRSDGFYAA